VKREREKLALTGDSFFQILDDQFVKQFIEDTTDSAIVEHLVFQALIETVPL
jgi:hypothetical protein